MSSLCSLMNHRLHSTQDNHRQRALPGDTELPHPASPDHTRVLLFSLSRFAFSFYHLRQEDV